MTMTFHIYKPRQFQWTRFGVNQSSGCGVQASARFQEPLSHPWACPLCPHRQMTMMLHMCRPRWFQKTRFGVNQPSGCGVPASTRFQEPLSCPWACPSCPHGQMTMALHIYRLRWFLWTWFKAAEFQRPHDTRSPYHDHGHVHYASMGKWPWHCKCAGQDSSN